MAKNNLNNKTMDSDDKTATASTASAASSATVASTAVSSAVSSATKALSSATAASAASTASSTAGNVVTGIIVQLRSIHPQDSYGRAGFRFSKTEKIEIQLSQLDALALAELQDDPWLDIEWVAE